jgi:hypothetical protein
MDGRKGGKKGNFKEHGRKEGVCRARGGDEGRDERKEEGW